MMAQFKTKGEHKMDVHYVRSTPCIVQEIEGYYCDHYDDFELAAVLQDQETVYQSIVRNRKNDGTESSSSESDGTCELNQTGSDTRVVTSQECVDIESQLVLDEAMARALQEVENQFARTLLTESGTDSSTTNHQSSPSGPTSSETSVRGDDINPDNMTYEELQSLGEAIGSVSKGLTDELISYLPTSKYKTGFFSRKEKLECAICCMFYKNRDVLITLPCKHEYHSKCISKWLKINKACPVCNVEVFGS